MKPHYSIVLVEPQGDLNIGSVARGMQNFGLTDLRMVNPVDYITDNAFMMACNAIPVLKKATSFPSVKEAISDSKLSIAFTRRDGKNRKELLSLKEAILEAQKVDHVSFVFGREDDGLTNDEVMNCNLGAYIPTSHDYPSLNLAQAVLLACHELFDSDDVDVPGEEVDYIARADLDLLIDRLRLALNRLDYGGHNDGKLREEIIKNMEKLFTRGRMREKECNMFHGFIARIIERCGD